MYRFYYQILGFVSTTRLLNVIVLCLTQYLISIYILAPERSLISLVLDFNLFIIVLVTAISTLSGFIINNLSTQNKNNTNQFKGYGNSLILQGGYLFIYDAIFLRRLKMGSIIKLLTHLKIPHPRFII